MLTQRRLYHIQGLTAWTSQAARKPHESPGVTRLEWSSHFSDSLFRMETKPLATAVPVNCIGIFIPFPMHIYTLLLTLRTSVPSTIKMNLSFHRYRLMESVTSHQSQACVCFQCLLPKGRETPEKPGTADCQGENKMHTHNHADMHA